MVGESSPMARASTLSAPNVAPEATAASYREATLGPLHQLQRLAQIRAGDRPQSAGIDHVVGRSRGRYQPGVMLEAHPGDDLERLLKCGALLRLKAAGAGHRLQPVKAGGNGHAGGKRVIAHQVDQG